MRDRAAFAVSALTSPFLVTGATAVLAVWLLSPGIWEFFLWVMIAGIFSAVIPFLFVLAMWRLGRLSDLHVAVRGQRAGPFVATLVSASVGLWLLRVTGAPRELIALGVAFILNGALLTVITLRWKASIHAATFAGCVIALGLIGTVWVLVGLTLLPAVFWARTHRQRHTLMQGLVPVLLVAATTPLVYEVAVRALAP